ncbi:MAG: PAS-domain containing protein [Paracoccaceae bacterium]
MTLIEWTGLAVVCLTTATFATYWIVRSDQRARFAASQLIRETEGKTTFLFDGDSLLDATQPAQNLIDDAAGDTDWQRLVGLLRPRFPDLPADTQALRARGPLKFIAATPGDAGTITSECWNGVTRIELSDDYDRSNSAADQHQLKSVSQELETLKQAMDGTPYPVWQADLAGTVTWFNEAYRKLHATVCTSGQNNVFDINIEDSTSKDKFRTSLSVPDSDSLYWFDITRVQTETHRMYYAVDVNAVVSAEISQRNFVQTLAKTFAQLSIGLAIFDRNRQLALFNPALIDLTALPAEFLSSRPNLLSFFDRLRDNRMMPEPKDYSSWREQIAELVAAASDGRYLETWTLASGPTYRVNGRPHPDGAVAFLFEDISAEISLTRRFRSELELGQSLLDTVEDAIVVFSSTGVLTMSNTGYRDLWGIDPDSSFVDMTVLDSIRHWQSNCEATPILSEIRDYVLEYTDRVEWDAPVRTKAGVDLICKVHPVTGGATMVRFQHKDDPLRLSNNTMEAATS